MTEPAIQNRLSLPLLALLLLVAVPGRADDRSLAEAGFAADLGGVRRCLKLFNPDESAQAEVARLIRQLGDDEFERREQATRALMNLPILPERDLRLAAGSDDLEVSMRAKQVLAKQTTDRSRSLLRAAMRAIVDQKIKGLTGELLTALPHLSYGDWKLAQAATATTAGPDDGERLLESLQNEAPVVRAVAAKTLAILRGKAAAEAIKTLFNDPDEHVQLVVAFALGDLEDPVCLMILGRLLQSKKVAVRVRAAQALRHVTGQKFGFVPTGPLLERRDKVQQWRQWLDRHAANAKLNFPFEVTGELVLFNGEDLTGWQLAKVNNAAGVVPGAAPGGIDRFWKAEDGKLVGLGPRSHLVTDQRFENYRMSFEWRWPQAGPRLLDAGVMLMAGAMGPDDGTFLEVQLYKTKIGDFYAINGFRVEPGGQLRTGPDSRFGRPKEKPVGDWNRMEVEVLNGKCSININGTPTNVATGCPQKPGRVGFMTEGSRLELRNLTLLPLDD